MYVLEEHFYPFGTTAPEPTPKPSIDPNTPTNVTVIKGKAAMLACMVRNVGKAAVSELFCPAFLFVFCLCTPGTFLSFWDVGPRVDPKTSIDPNKCHCY